MNETTIIILAFIIFIAFISMISYREITVLHKRLTALETATVSLLEIIVDTSRAISKCAHEYMDDPKSADTESKA